MDDAECPYCGKSVEICHDDGYGYDENETFVQECDYCDKTFTYTTSISFCYHTEQAPCQNGEEHNLTPVCGWPKELFVGVERCEWCDEEVITDIDAHKKAREQYSEELKIRRSGGRLFVNG